MTKEKKKKTSPDNSAWIRQDHEASEDTEPSKLAAGLYIVATPIGNLGDITLRALRTLEGVDVVLAEDTRVTGALLRHYGISKKLLSYNEHNAAARQEQILEHLAKGASLALTSDAGTPLVSDPGARLVQVCRKQGIMVTAIPGASALLTGLVVAGLPTDRFMFAGFPPPKTTARKTWLKEFAAWPTTLIFYESPSRLAASLRDMAEVLGETRDAAVGRELTKWYEEVRHGTLGELAAGTTSPPKGEIVVIVGPPAAKEQVEVLDLDKFLRQTLATQSLRDTVEAVATATGLPKREVYRRALALQG